MLDGLRQFIAEVISPAHEPRDLDDTGYRLAATALLVHVISLDGEPSDAEKRKRADVVIRTGLSRYQTDRQLRRLILELLA